MDEMTESKDTFQPGLISQRKKRHAEEYLFVLGVRRLAGCPLLPPLCCLPKKCVQFGIVAITLL